MIKTILISLFSLPFIYCATIIGHVSDSNNHKGLMGANLIVENTDIGAATDNDGFFKILNLSAGKYIFNVSYIGYYTQNVPVFIKDTSEVVHLEIKLTADSNYHGTIIVTHFPVSPEYNELIDSLQSHGYLPSSGNQTLQDTVSLIENYYKYFQRLKPENILSITVDSLAVVTIGHTIKIYSTFHNESDTTEYICGCLKCGSLPEPIIYNSSGQTIKHIGRSYVSEGIIPDSFYFFTIEPHSSVKYTPVWLSLDAFDNYPSGIYYIKLKYTGRRKPSMWGNSALNWLYKKPKYVNYMALTGEFISKDSLMYRYEKIHK